MLEREAKLHQKPPIKGDRKRGRRKHLVRKEKRREETLNFGLVTELHLTREVGWGGTGRT